MSTKNHKPTTTSDILPGTLFPEVPLTKEEHDSPAHPASSIEHPVSPLPSHPASVPPTNPPTDKSNNPLSTRARCGKVARLPKEIRDQLNQMLLDGIPHAKIIQNLRDKFGTGNADISASTDPNVLPLSPSDGERAGVRGFSSTSDSDHESPLTNHATRTTEHAPDSDHASRITNQEPGFTDHDSSAPASNSIENLNSLTPLNITNWKKFGGYRDWLRDQERLEQCRLRHELTLDLARSAEGLASYQAAPKVAVAQICQTIIDLGPEGLKDAMKDHPLNTFRLLNALARLINSGLKCERLAIEHPAEVRPEKPGGLTQGSIKKMHDALNMM